ncbi:PPE domain-containing protein [Mycobacterium simulans]
MASAAAPHLAWMNTTATRSQRTAAQIRSAAGAFEIAFAATVPPPVASQLTGQLSRAHYQRSEDTRLGAGRIDIRGIG